MGGIIPSRNYIPGDFEVTGDATVGGALAVAGVTSNGPIANGNNQPYRGKTAGGSSVDLMKITTGNVVQIGTSWFEISEVQLLGSNLLVANSFRFSGVTGLTIGSEAFAIKSAKQVSRAHGNINGTAVPAALVNGYNVASVTDNGVGNYTATFTTAMAANTYVVPVGSTVANARASTRTTASVTFNLFNDAGASADGYLDFAVFEV